MGKIMMMTKAAAIIGAGMIAMSARATTVNLTVGATGYDVLGETLPGNIGGAGGQAQDESSDVNGIIGLALGGSAGDTKPGDIYYYRSVNVFSPLPAANFTSGYVLGGPTTQITLVGTGYRYLVARWDGPNAGAEVWDIADLAAGTVINVPQNVEPDSTGLNLVVGQQYGITSWTLFNPMTPPPPAVPDGASTVTLLGAVVTGFSLIRRKIASH